jgi:hypothetical protein
VFDELVRRDDKPEILTYERLSQRYFFAVDYGFAFGGTPYWNTATLPALPDPFLRSDGTMRLRTLQAPIIAKLRTLIDADIIHCIEDLGLPRFGLDIPTGTFLANAIGARAAFLVSEYDRLAP